MFCKKGGMSLGDEITFEIAIPTDEDGFVLLKCPICGELFKLIPSDYRDDSVSSIYCPSCGLAGESYITDDVLELAMNIAENQKNELVLKTLKKLERKTKGSMIRIETKTKIRKKSEQPIMLTVENLEQKVYPCCKLAAKIKPILKMSGSYCPYCGVMDYGIE